MKICNATGCGICVNCNHTPPTINGYKRGDICRLDVEEILEALEDGDLVCYNPDNGKFYRRMILVDTACYIKEDYEQPWEVVIV